ncbi:hypothetical protein [Algoriphagus pacificus]|uniref:Uncharacterized protein n=1 Tax=Algoriphagus pacificus TaxID=2811234 RepID=A0ABS3CJS2_9BACT|nr:hypothetical protein [Algoriphagus pacificus]MBN7817348.1 hypothetical protein [Algoriphagus pacificus]
MQLTAKELHGLCQMPKKVLIASKGMIGRRTFVRLTSILLACGRRRLGRWTTVDI